MPDEKITDSLDNVIANCIINIITTATKEGLSANVEAGIDLLYCAVPTRYKTNYIKKWDAVNTPIPESLVGSPEGKQIKANRVLTKFQIDNDIYAHNSWFFKTRNKPYLDIIDKVEVPEDGDEK